MRSKETRVAKANQIQKSLFEAAAIVVGRDGYEAASITKITTLAGVANGTFYNYFENRQDLFDKLLPTIGDTLIDFIRDRVDGKASARLKERQRITAYFEFFDHNPGFLRLLNEAEVFAPLAYSEHMQRFSIRYIRALQRSRDDGELTPFDDKELEAVAFMLFGCRSYMTLLLKESKRHDVKELIDTYLKLILPGLFRDRE